MAARIQTGIPGFDDLVEGGFNPNSTNLVAAGPGCGKTIFCMQFLWNGATQYNEPGLFVSFEENIDDLKNDAQRFGWDFGKLDGKVRFVYYATADMRDAVESIKRHIQETGAKRVVIDSTSVYGMMMETPFEVRKGLYELAAMLKSLNCVSLLTTEVTDAGSKYSRFGVEEFLADSIVHISFESLGGAYSRSLIVRKMRRTKNNEDVHPLEIGPNGIIVHNIG